MTALNLQSQNHPYSPQVNVNIEMSVIPFGSLRVQEAWFLSEKGMKPPHEQEVEPDEFYFPEGTSISIVVPLPGPMLVISY